MVTDPTAAILGKSEDLPLADSADTGLGSAATMGMIRENRPYRVTVPSFGISAFTSRHGSRFRMPLSRHAFHKIVFVVEGNGSLRHESDTVELKARTVVRVPAGVAHRFQDAVASPMTLAVLCLTDPATQELPGRIWTDAEQVLRVGIPIQLGAADTTAARLAIRQIGIEAASQGRYIAAVAVGHVVLLLAQTLEAAARNRAEPVMLTGIDESVHWLDRHFTQRISINDLAARSGMCYRAYTSAFRAHTGMTVVSYISTKRLGLADHLIRQTGDVLTSSIEAGFNDLSHFYRSFTRHFNRTPAQRQHT